MSSHRVRDRRGTPAAAVDRDGASSRAEPPVPRAPAQPRFDAGAPVPGGGRPGPGGVWRARPVLAGFLQILLFALPFAAGLLAAWGVSRALPPPPGFWSAAGEWLAVFAAALAAVYLVSRAARRAMPLPMLLRLALAFPDRAPGRYRLAARAGMTRRLHEQLAVAQEAGLDDEPTRAVARILALLAALAAHDPKTRGHCERVRAYNDLISEQLGLPEGDRERLRWAALIHDIGKLDVPTRVLNKPAALDQTELELLRHHPLRGLAIAAPLAAWLGPWATGIDQHHERWDGSGYPYGLRGEQIGLGARIVAVADAFEVMTAPRSYSRAVTAIAARAELVRCAGSQFDPQVVRAFLEISLPRLRAVAGPLAWFSALPFLLGRSRLGARVVSGGQHAAMFAGGLAGAAAIATVAISPVPGPHLTPVPVSGSTRPPAAAGVASGAPRAFAPASSPARTGALPAGGSDLRSLVDGGRLAALAASRGAAAPVATATGSAPTGSVTTGSVTGGPAGAGSAGSGPATRGTAGSGTAGSGPATTPPATTPPATTGSGTSGSAAPAPAPPPAAPVSAAPAPTSVASPPARHGRPGHRWPRARHGRGRGDGGLGPAAAPGLLRPGWPGPAR